MDDLAKIDILKDRFNVSYKLAKEALEDADGDIVTALIALEERKKNWRNWKPDEFGHNLWVGMKKNFSHVSGTKIKVKKDGATVFQVPITLGLLATLGALSNKNLALVAGLSSLGAMLKGYYLELEGQTEKEEDEFIFIS
mgnify:CR=1 FL=1